MNDAKKILVTVWAKDVTADRFLGLVTLDETSMVLDGSVSSLSRTNIFTNYLVLRTGTNCSRARAKMIWSLARFAYPSCPTWCSTSPPCTQIFTSY